MFDKKAMTTARISFIVFPELSGVVMDVDSSLKEIEGLLKEEEKQEAEFQVLVAFLMT